MIINHKALILYLHKISSVCVAQVSAANFCMKGETREKQHVWVVKSIMCGVVNELTCRHIPSRKRCGWKHHTSTVKKHAWNGWRRKKMRENWEKVFHLKRQMNEWMNEKASEWIDEEKKVSNYSPGTAYHFKFISANHLNLASRVKKWKVREFSNCSGSWGLKQKWIITVDDTTAPLISDLVDIQTFQGCKGEMKACLLLKQPQASHHQITHVHWPTKQEAKGQTRFLVSSTLIWGKPESIIQ